MFERFTPAARHAVVLAQEEARTLRHRHVGTEHLLLALIDQRDAPVGQLLARLGVTREAAVAAVVRHIGSEELNSEALRALGIDLDVVRERVEAAFGRGSLDAGRGGAGSRTRGHIPFSRRAKKVLELSLREALALKSRSIGDVHILLGLLREGGGLGVRVLADLGVDLADLRREVLDELAA